MQATRTIDVNRFKNAVGLTTTSRLWGVRRKADLSKVDTATADKSRLALSKVLIQCEEYEAIKSAFGSLTAWVYGRTGPGFFRKGFKWAGVSAVPGCGGG